MRCSRPLQTVSRDILVVEDECSIREMLAFTLTRHGFTCREAKHAAAAYDSIAQRLPDLIVLDWMLPDMSGLDYLRLLKQEQRTCRIPVLMLSARAMEEDKVQGLDAGADDYVAKPFMARELVARIGALLRRTVREQISVAGLTIDLASHRVWADGRSCPLGRTEYRLLQILMTHAGRLHGRTELKAQIWPANTCVDLRTVDTHIRRLRQALAPFGYDGLIQTVRGSGYRLCAPGRRKTGG
jgi:two-component system phosphate regulon response regulator PhoB